MSTDPRAGTPAQPEDLVDVDALLAAYHDRTRTPTTRRSGSRSAPPGTAARRCETTFNDDHIAATSQAICEYRAAQGTDGPLFLGRDTHALSEPAWITAIEVFAANGVHVLADADDGFTPTPAVSHAILHHNRGRTGGLADGVVVTPSHNPPADGGFKYNPPNGGPADTDATDVDRRPGQRAAARRSSTGCGGARSTGAASSAATTSSASTSPTCPPCWTWTRSATPGCASAPTRWAGPAWPTGGRSRERHRLDLTVVNPDVDPQFGFMTLDWDGKIRMDCSSPYAMASLVQRPGPSSHRHRQRRRRRPARHRHRRRADEPQPLPGRRHRLPVRQPPGLAAGRGRRQDRGQLVDDRPGRRRPGSQAGGDARSGSSGSCPGCSTARSASAARRARARRSCAATAACGPPTRTGSSWPCSPRRSSPSPGETPSERYRELTERFGEPDLRAHRRGHHRGGQGEAGQAVGRRRDAPPSWPATRSPPG